MPLALRSPFRRSALGLRLLAHLDQLGAHPHLFKPSAARSKLRGPQSVGNTSQPLSLLKASERAMPGGRLRAYSSAASAAASACSKSSLSSLTSLPSALGASELSDGPSSSPWLASESEAASASGKGHWGCLCCPGAIGDRQRGLTPAHCHL